MNYLDNAYGVSQVEEGVSNLLRRGRSLETKQERTLDDLTLLPWTKGADQEKRLFEYQLGVSGFIFMGLMSHQYQFALTWFHIGPIHPNIIYQMARCFHPPCLWFRINFQSRPSLPSLLSPPLPFSCTVFFQSWPSLPPFYQIINSGFVGVCSLVNLVSQDQTTICTGLDSNSHLSVCC